MPQSSASIRSREFGLDVLTIGRMRYDAILPCFIAAIAADQIGMLWGIRHTHYAVSLVPQITVWTLSATLVAGALFGLIGMIFANATHGLPDYMKKRIRYAPLRPFIGGLIVVIAVWAIGTHRYIGLGIPTLVESFQQQLPPWDFAGNMAFTVVSLGTGFKGGEVTRCFILARR